MLKPKYKLFFTYRTTGEQSYHVIYTDAALRKMLDKLEENPYLTNIYFEPYIF